MSHITTSKQLVRWPTLYWTGLPDPTRRENPTNPRVGSENQPVKRGQKGRRGGRVVFFKTLFILVVFVPDLFVGFMGAGENLA